MVDVNPANLENNIRQRILFNEEDNKNERFSNYFYKSSSFFYWKLNLLLFIYLNFINAISSKFWTFKIDDQNDEDIVKTFESDFNHTDFLERFLDPQEAYFNHANFFERFLHPQEAYFQPFNDFNGINQSEQLVSRFPREIIDQFDPPDTVLSIMSEVCFI